MEQLQHAAWRTSLMWQLAEACDSRVADSGCALKA